MSLKLGSNCKYQSLDDAIFHELNRKSNIRDIIQSHKLAKSYLFIYKQYFSVEKLGTV